MADLTPEPADRAQLLIVAALGLAVLVALLAMALNTAVYGEVHALGTDDSLQEEAAAVEYRESARRAVTDLLNGTAGYEGSASEFRSEVDAWVELTRPEYARDGAATNATATGVTERARVVQDEERNFTDAGGATAWTVADEARTVENYSMTVDASALAQTSDCASADDCFTVTARGDNGSVWRMYVYSGEGNETVEVDVETADGSTTGCTVERNESTINVTAGVVDPGGEECAFEPFVADPGLDAPYNLTYADAGNVSGTYGLTVEGRVVNGTVEEDERYGTTGSPRVDVRVVAATIRVSYRSPDLTYETELRVAPGEDDE